MGTVAPKHYLICDGAKYSITDYPYLAQHMIDSFGKVNYFGGDGVNTFAVPDLRGEFLRGTGTALRNTGTGGDVGEHQDGTISPMIGGKEAAILWLPTDDGTQAWPQNVDKYLKEEGNTDKGKYINKEGTWDNNSITHYTSRPTNTAVLYCIKYEPTYYMQISNPLVGRGETILWEGVANGAGTELTLKDDINNYSEIKIVCIWYEQDGYITDYLTSVEDINNAYSTHNGTILLSYCTGNSDSAHLWVKMKNNICTIVHDYGDGYQRIAKIVGIKYAELPENTELTYTDEEISTMVSDILGGEE